MPLATLPTDHSPEAYIERIDSESKRKDAQALLHQFEIITGHPPVVWGDFQMIGFGTYSYTRKGQKEEFQWFRVGFSARKARLTVYLTTDIEKHQDLLDKLGKHKHGRGCLYINKLADVDMGVLKELIEKGWGEEK